MNESKTYTLAELAEEFGLTERTARYWIEKFLPPHHKQGRGKLARYGQDTWNCFAFIQLADERYGLRPGQVAEVLAEVPQITIDRVVAGEEELKVMAVPTSEQDVDSVLRAVKKAGQHQALRDLLATERARLPSLAREDIVSFQRMAEPELEELSDAPEGASWQTVHVDDRVRIDCRVAGKVTMRQHEQIRIAARLIRLALE